MGQKVTVSFSCKRICGKLDTFLCQISEKNRNTSKHWIKIINGQNTDSANITGLYYVPNNPHKDWFTFDHVIFENKDICQEFFQTDVYKLLQRSMQKAYQKLVTTGARTVTLGSRENSFQQDRELEQLSKSYKTTPFYKQITNT